MPLKDEMKTHLVRDILPYWMGRTIDNVYGGFVGRIDGSNQLDPKSGKGGVLNARILWTFSAAYNKLKIQSIWKLLIGRLLI